MAEQIGRNINDDKARAFQMIVTAGWGNLSDGTVEAPTGHFALIHILPSEVPELVDAVFDDTHLQGTVEKLVYPGSYLLTEDSDGNAELIEFYTLNNALTAYNRAQREFAIWNATCPECGNEGPHDRLDGNLHRCSCGRTWDPTDGVGVQTAFNGKLV